MAVESALTPQRTSGPINLRCFSLAAGSQGVDCTHHKGVVHRSSQRLRSCGGCIEAPKEAHSIIARSRIPLARPCFARDSDRSVFLAGRAPGRSASLLVVLVLLSLVSNLSALIVLSFIGVCCLSCASLLRSTAFPASITHDLIAISAFVITSFVVNFLVTRGSGVSTRPYEDLRDAARRQPKIGSHQRSVADRERGARGAEQALRELVEQQTAISEVLRAIVNSPHDLQPIFDAILDSSTRLCRADVVTLRLSEESGLRLVAMRGDPLLVSHLWSSFPALAEKGSLQSRIATSRLPAHIPDLAALESDRRDDSWIAAVNAGYRATLIVPLLKDNEIVGTITLGRKRVQPFTDKQISLFRDFAAQATIALESTRRERQYREAQSELAHANRVATMGQLTASITHEVNQPITAAVTYTLAARRFLARSRLTPWGG